jgi:hypothetical protein
VEDGMTAGEESVSRRRMIGGAGIGAAIGAMALSAGAAGAQAFGPEGSWLLRWEFSDYSGAKPTALLYGGVAISFDAPRAERDGTVDYESGGVGAWEIRPDGAIGITVVATKTDPAGAPFALDYSVYLLAFDSQRQLLLGSVTWSRRSFDGQVIADRPAAIAVGTRIHPETLS